MHKSVPPPKTQSTSTSGIEKRKKEKSTRKYVAAKEESELDEEVREVKKTTKFAKFVKKPISGVSPSPKKAKTQGEPSGETGESKKKSEIDEALKFGKIEGSFTIVPPL